jgi:hypothetical protein
MKKNDLIVEEAKKRFQQITEYVVSQGSRQVLEADDETEEPQGDMGGDPNAMGGDPNMMGGDPNAMGAGDPNAMGGDPNAMGGDPNMMGGDPNAMGAGDPNAMGGEGTPEGFAPQDAMGGEDPNMMGGDPNAMGGEPMQPDDEVIDVDELTDSQEETEKEVAKINSKFDKVIKAIGAFEELLRSNDEKIDNLRDEFEKRNPSKIEKLQMQTANSYPFNQRPEDYWKEKEATSNYQVVDDDLEEDKDKFIITTNDVAGNENWKEIADTLDDDILFNQTLNKILGL